MFWHPRSDKYFSLIPRNFAFIILIVFPSREMRTAIRLAALVVQWCL